MKMIQGSYIYADQKKQRFSRFLAVVGSLSAFIAFSFAGMGAFSQVTSLPIVQTKEATNIQQTSAVLNGVVNPNGYPTTYYYEYGETVSLGSRTPMQTIGISNSSVPIPVPISVYDLAPNTQYSFVLVAQNQFGVSRTAAAHFATPGPDVNNATIPSVATNAASDIYGTTAILRGYTDATNVNGEAWFEYGTDPNMLLTSTSPTNILPVEFYRAADVSPIFTAKLTNLAPGTTYYFRAALRRAGRTGYGALMSFRTLGGAPTSPDYSNPAYAYTPIYSYAPQTSYVAPTYAPAYIAPSYSYASPAYVAPAPASYASSYSYASPTYASAYSYAPQTNASAYSYSPSYGYDTSLANYSYGYGYPTYSSNYAYPQYYSYVNSVPYSATVPANVSQLASANYFYGQYGSAYQYPTYSYPTYAYQNQTPSVVNIYSYPAAAGGAQPSLASENAAPAKQAAEKTTVVYNTTVTAPAKTQTAAAVAEPAPSMDQTQSAYQQSQPQSQGNLTASVSRAAQGVSAGAIVFGFILLCIALALLGWFLWGRRMA